MIMKEWLISSIAAGLFKDLLDERGKLEEWYAFEEISELAALKEWLTENDITYVDDCTQTEEAQKLAALLEQEG